MPFVQIVKVLFSVGLALLVYCLISLLASPQIREYFRLRRRLARISNIGKGHNALNDDSESFRERIIKPATDRILSFFERIFPVSQKEKDTLSSQLMLAGYKIKPSSYASLRMATIIGLALVGLLVGFLAKGTALAAACGVFFGFYVGYVFFRFTLSSAVTKRREEIKSQIPEFLDLLVVCVEAGLGFDQGIGYVITQSQGALIDEFKLYQRDTALGRSRKDALMKLCDRCAIDELKTFGTAVVQADELGISLKNVLNAQSESIRIAHKQAFEEKIQKLPIKILLPMIGLIFPVLFIIILGPAVPGLLSVL